MQKLNDLSRSLIALEPAGTLIAVIEMSLSSWLVAGIVPGIERQPLKKLAVDESALLKLLHRWREEAEKAGCRIERIVVAFEAGRDGFWLARWLKARDIEAYVGTAEWEGRAGGYAIQGRGAALVERVEGDYLNVVGLPAALLVRVLAERFPGAYGVG